VLEVALSLLFLRVSGRMSFVTAIMMLSIFVGTLHDISQELRERQEEKARREQMRAEKRAW
jgi:hypothetical protein